MKYYLIAGEASGDLHGSNLMKAIRERDSEAVFRCWGGDLMQAQGGEVVRHYRELAFMGFTEVLLNMRTIVGNLNYCYRDIRSFQPDVVILIDYPGFNLRVAENAHKAGFRVAYYISPQVWAWKKSRVHAIRKYVDRMFVILPFEKEFYDRYHYPVDFVGHPLLDVIDPEAPCPPEENSLPEKPYIALLPGSRKQEIDSMLPLMLSVIPFFPSYRFVVAGAPGIEPSYYQHLMSRNPVPLLMGKTYALLQGAEAALVTSGTASLEAALFRIPQVICYKGGAISYAIARKIVDIKYIGLPNLIMDREVITELIQHKVHTASLVRELNAILTDPSRRAKILLDYQALHEKLGGKGASDRTAEYIYSWLSKEAGI